MEETTAITLTSAHDIMKTIHHINKAILASLVASCFLCGNTEARNARFFSIREQNQHVINQLKLAESPAELIAAAPLLQYLPDFRKYKAIKIKNEEPIPFENLTSRQAAQSLEWFSESEGIWYPDIENFKVFDELYFPVIDQFLRKLRAKVEIINYQASVQYAPNRYANISTYNFNKHVVKNRKLIAVMRLKKPEQILHIKNNSKLDIEIILYSIPEVFDQLGVESTPATKGLKEANNKDLYFCSYVSDSNGDVALKFKVSGRNFTSRTYFYNFASYKSVHIIAPHFMNMKNGRAIHSIFAGFKTPEFCLNAKHAAFSKGAKVIFATQKPDRK